MKQKPFIMQGLCLGMILFGMHSFFCHAFLQEIDFKKFFIALLIEGIWFTMLSVCPMEQLEKNAKQKMQIPFLKHPVADAFLVLSLVILAGYALEHIVRLQKDARVLYTAVVYQYDRYFGHYSGVFGGLLPKVNGSRLLFCVETLLAIFMAKAFSWRSGMFFGTLPVVVLVSGGLLLGLTPSIPDMVCIVCGVLGMQMLTGSIRPGGRKGFRQKTAGSRRYKRVYPVVAVLLAVSFVSASVLSLATADTCLKGEKQLLAFQHKMERKVVDASVRTIQKLMMLLGIDQTGVLNNIAPSFTGETVLTITTDKKPTDDFYLRGFVGSRYENGRWSNETPQDASKYNFWDSRYLLMTQDYTYAQDYIDTMQKMEDVISSQTMQMDSGDSSVESDDAENDGDKQASSQNTIRLKIQYADKNRTAFGYLPYYSLLEDDSTGSFLLDGDCGIRREEGVSEYNVRTVYGVSLDTLSMSDTTLLYQGGKTPVVLAKADGELDESVWTMSDDDGEQVVVSGTARGLDSAGVDYFPVASEEVRDYCRYVLSYDTWLPSTGLEKTKKLAKELTKSGEVDLSGEEEGGNLGERKSAGIVISELRRFLGSTTTYSQKLRAKLSQEDYVENFLFRQKKGYCEHYATAGAVLFRAMGVPARYVSGYKVSPEDFVQNEDGTYTAEVPDSRAHAWTEVYVYETGWTVADMTPSDDHQDIPPERDASQMVDNDDNEDEFLDSSQQSSDKVTPEDKVTPTPEAQKEKNQEKKEKKEQTKKEQGEKDPQSTDAGMDAPLPGQGNQSGGQAGGANWEILFYAGMALVFLAILAFGWHLQAWLRYRKLRKCNSHREYLLTMNRMMESYLRCCGRKGVSRMSDNEYLKLLAELYPEGQERGDWERYYQILEQARFAKNAGSVEEIRWCKRLLYQLGDKSIQRCQAPRRFYVRWVRNWRVSVHRKNSSNEG